MGRMVSNAKPSIMTHGNIPQVPRSGSRPIRERHAAVRHCPALYRSPAGQCSMGVSRDRRRETWSTAVANSVTRASVRTASRSRMPQTWLWALNLRFLGCQSPCRACCRWAAMPRSCTFDLATLASVTSSHRAGSACGAWERASRAFLSMSCRWWYPLIFGACM